MADRPDLTQLALASQRALALTLIPAVLLWGIAVGGLAVMLLQPAFARALVWIGADTMLASALAVIAVIRLVRHHRAVYLAARGLSD